MPANTDTHVLDPGLIPRAASQLSLHSRSSDRLDFTDVHFAQVYRICGTLFINFATFAGRCSYIVASLDK